ncbi:MAG: NAD(P)/FAD-dependent oxidoreductase, partial [Cyanobacteriota bacterium erpe_2018_sw_39hr_WHONDRS-SW48-000098_B_bin.30]|nr:NAD(P)/FAD-dependent oxidoreductase [Cyanobacteriota bacterium erpe_2018_sw_39hr_WHONDRS-SW48-000098_B_bin.30]
MTRQQKRYDQKDYDVIVIGAGGAGMMCAAEAGKRGRTVLLLDHNDEIGKKILISGGGRCNFTNVGARPECYVSNNPHFAKSALSRYTPQDFIKLVEGHRIKYHEKKLGQLFCNDSARQIVDMLVDECDQAGCHVELGVKVKAIQKSETWQIITEKGDFTSESLVIATGGLSIPQIGATGFGYDIAR